MVNGRIIALILAALAVMAAPLPPAAAEIPELEAQLAALEAQLEALQAQRQTWLACTDTLAFQIETLKRSDKNGLGVSERKLTKALQESVVLSQRIEALDRQVAAMKNQVEQNRRELQQAYETQIAALLKQIESTDGPDREGLTRKATSYLSAKLRLQAPLSLAPDTRLVRLVEVSPKDGPELIREKADLVLDVADKLRAELARVNTRLTDLKRQQSMGDKMRQFTEEIAFFDEDLSVGRTIQPQEPAAVEPPAETDDREYTGEDVTLSPTDKGESDGPPAEPTQEALLSAQYVEPVWSAETPTAAWGGLQAQIDSLSAQRSRLEQLSKSLSEKAERFYLKAEALQ